MGCRRSTGSGAGAPDPDAWLRAGFTPIAAARWDAAGFDPVEAAAWAIACADVGLHLLGLRDPERSDATSLDAALAGEWRSYATSPEEMLAFRLQGFRSGEAAGWLIERFGAVDAAAWARAGAVAPDARSLLDAGLCPDDAARLNALDGFELDDD